MPEAHAATIVWGIPGCDQVRRARAWLRARGVPHECRDLRAHGLPADAMRRWLALPAPRRAIVVDRSSAAEAMLAEPTPVERPVVEAPGRLLVGFTVSAFESAFGATGARAPG